MQRRGATAPLLAIAAILFCVPPLARHCSRFSAPEEAPKPCRHGWVEIQARKTIGTFCLESGKTDARTLLKKVLPRSGCAEAAPKGTILPGTLIKLRKTDSGCRVRAGKMPIRRRLMLGMRVDANTATPEELAALPGVNRVSARRLVKYRERHGPFENVWSLVRVRGIGWRTAQRLKKVLLFSRRRRRNRPSRRLRPRPPPKPAPRRKQP